METPPRSRSDAPDPRPDPRAQDLFAAFLKRRDAGEGVDFESLCAEHPDLAEDLRRLHAQWSDVVAALEGLGATGSLARVLREQVDLSVSETPAASARSDFSSEVMRRLAGRRGAFGRYRLQGELARGGMGAILRVWDDDLRRHLAMKVILGRGAPDAATGTPPIEPRELARFLEEAQVTGQLDHPGIVPVHELGLDPEGRVYFTMKLVKGHTLKEIFDWTRNGREGWTRTRALGVLLRVCEAMAYAHDKGVLHRDLKPSNVMVGRFGEVFVMDWGLARLLGEKETKDIRIRDVQPTATTTELRTERRDHGDADPDSPLYTMDGDVLGTPAYMSPEQADGRIAEMGPASDVYSAGAMLYHLLAGRIPYTKPGARADNAMIWMWVRGGSPPALHSIAPDAPAELVAICEHAMERDPQRRYPDMLALRDDLRAFLERRVVRAYRTGAAVELQKWVLRNRVAASLLGALAVAIVGGSVAFGLSERARAREASLAIDERRAAALVAEAPSLWPTTGERVQAMVSWRAAAEELLARGAPHREELAALRARGAPPTAEDRLAAEERLAGQVELAAWRRMLAMASPFLDRARATRADPSAPAADREQARDAIEGIEPELATWSERVAALERQAARGLRWRFADPDDAARAARLASVVSDLDELARPGTGLLARVSSRFAGDAAAATRPDAGASPWREAIASIADAARCPSYGGLRIAPQAGLVPLRRNDDTALWEFWLPMSGERPAIAADGRLRVAPETGIVLVLVPGGRATLGAAREASPERRGDQDARAGEGPLQEVELGPFFLSAFEMTQGQWLRLTGTLPSKHFAGFGQSNGVRITRSNPVESVSFEEAVRSLAAWGLVLPTEAQWEWAARAGGEGRYGNADDFEDLRGRASYWDSTAALGGLPPSGPAPFDDGFIAHGPVDAFAPNRFGLHCMLGNVIEWCRDAFASAPELAPPRPGDGLRVGEVVGDSAVRGGGFKSPPSDLRITRRYGKRPTATDEALGLRPCRGLDP